MSKQSLVLKKDKFIELMKDNQCNISLCSKILGVNRNFYTYHVSKDPVFALAIKEANESVIDGVESELHKQIKSGEVTSTIFFLKTKGRERGYSDSDAPQINTDNINITIVQPPTPEDKDDDIIELKD